jgi:hypothetical protein
MRSCETPLSWSLLNHSTIPRSHTVRCLLPSKGSLVLLRLQLLNSISRTHALSFSPGELICGTIDDNQARSTYPSFLLPEICSPPLGLVWPTTIGFAKFKEIFQVLGRAYKPFASLLDAIEPQLHHWFVAVSTSPERFSIPSCDYLEETAPAFPSIGNSTYPKQISDPRGFSPLVDMRYAFLCCLNYDQVLTMTSGPGQQQFNSFLQRREAGITASTYLGAANPGRFCPNFGFHFKPDNDVWPTESNPIEHFTAKFLVSLEARDYEPVTIEVHSDRWASIRSLLTRDQLLTQRHHANTPRQSRAPSPTPPGESATQPLAAPAPAPPIPDPIHLKRNLHAFPM